MAVITVYNLILELILDFIFTVGKLVGIPQDKCSCTGLLLLCCWNFTSCHADGSDLQGKSLSAAQSFCLVALLIWRVTVGEHISRAALLESCTCCIYSVFTP